MISNRPATEVPLKLSALPLPSTVPAAPDPIADAWECTDPGPAHSDYEGTPVADYSIAKHTILLFETDNQTSATDTTYAVVWQHDSDWLAGYLCRPRALPATLSTLTHGIMSSAYDSALDLRTVADAAADHDGVSPVDHQSQLQSPTDVLDEFDDAPVDDIEEVSLWITDSEPRMDESISAENSQTRETVDELLEDQWPVKRDRTFDSESGTWL